MLGDKYHNTCSYYVSINILSEIRAQVAIFTLTIGARHLLIAQEPLILRKNRFFHARHIDDSPPRDQCKHTIGKNGGLSYEGKSQFWKYP